jgi:DNA-binding response OmpR family regulator
MNILVVDDEPLSRKMLSVLLEGEGFELIMAESMRAARTALIHDTPNLIILDVGLPDGDGFTFCRQVMEEETHIPIILLTSRDTLKDKLTGFKYGADDYIVKPYEFSELIERVKAVLRRSSYMQHHLVQDQVKVGDLDLNVGELKLRVRGKQVIQLTPTEMKILGCLMSNVGVVLKRSRIAEIALGYDYGGASNVVDVYIRRLRKKMEVDPTRPQYIETVVGSGYRMCKPLELKTPVV